MARKTYGTTWWGRQWLNSLTGIDYANRIPRGKTYANNGCVFDLQVDTSAHQITAKVEGNYDPFYNVVLKFKEEDPVLVSKFVKKLSSNIAVITRLSNRELDPAVYQIAKECDIELLPTNWHSIHMKCSCPDSAVPCKHIAAVIYKASEIFDANPFLLFELKGIDLAQELSKLGFTQEQATAVETPHFAHMYEESLITGEELLKIAQKFNFELDEASPERIENVILYRDIADMLPKSALTLEQMKEVARLCLQEPLFAEYVVAVYFENKAKSEVLQTRLSELDLDITNLNKEIEELSALHDSLMQEYSRNRRRLTKYKEANDAAFQRGKKFEKLDKIEGERNNLNLEYTSLKERTDSLLSVIETIMPEALNKRIRRRPSSESIYKKFVQNEVVKQQAREEYAQKVMDNNLDDSVEPPSDDFVRYQSNIFALKDLTFVDIPEISSSLIGLYAENAPGFTHGNMRDALEFYMTKAALLASNQLKDNKDRDIAQFITDEEFDTHWALWGDDENYDKLKEENSHLLTESDYFTSPSFSRESISSVGFLAQRPWMYLSASGMLMNNIPIKVNHFDKVGQHESILQVIPNNLPYQLKNVDGIHDMFSAFTFKEESLVNQRYEYRILAYLWYIASRLVKAKAIMPQLIVDYQERLRCRWIPAIVSQEIRDLTVRVGLSLQGLEHCLFHRTDRMFYLDPLFLGQLMLSTFIQSYIGSAFVKYAPAKDLDILEYNVLFMYQHINLLDNAEDIRKEGVRMRLESYLSPLQISNIEYIPVIRLVDLSNEVEVNNSVFVNLKDQIREISEKTRLTLLDSIEKYNQEDNYADDEFFADAKKLHLAASANEVGEYEYECVQESKESFLQDTNGIGLEFGFLNLPDEIKNSLEEQGKIDVTGMVPLRLILNDDLCKNVRHECLRTASRIVSVDKELESIFSSKYNVCILSLETLQKSLHIITQSLHLLGVRVFMSRTLSKLLKPSSTMKVDMKEDQDPKKWENSGLLDLTSMLSFNWQLAIGEHQLTEKEFKMLMANANRVVRFRNNFVFADANALEKIRKNLINLANTENNPLTMLRSMLTGSFNDNDLILGERVKDKLLSLSQTKDYPLPEGLNAQLRPYQKQGYNWLMHNIRNCVGSILADDMGLGKTLQVITLLLSLKEQNLISNFRPVLVVVPTTLITNWKREVEKFAPKLTVQEFYGKLKLDSIVGDIVLSSYGTVRSRIKDVKKFDFYALVIDEAQAIKNLGTAITKTMRSIKADNYIAMSGTPVENRLLDYYSILDFVNRGLFGTTEVFKKEFVNPIEKQRDPKAVERFKSLTAPFMLRRVKTDKKIISDLPDKLVNDTFCHLSKTQVTLYKSAVEDCMERIAQCEEPLERNAILLGMISQLKAICNSPRQYNKDDLTLKADDSGKVSILLDLLNNVLESNEGKALIFTQSVIMGELLQDIIEEKFNIRPDFLHGGCSTKERAQMVDSFQNEPRKRFLLLSLRAAGTGLNLTAANFVIHFDLWWNPAVENQATDRAFRIGQQRNVQVYRLISANTFEERINELIQAKTHLASITVDDSGETSWLSSLSQRQIEALFALSDSNDNGIED